MRLITTPAVLCFIAALVTGCASAPFGSGDSGPDREVDIASIPDAIPTNEPPSSGGNPQSYVINGQRYYVLKSGSGYVEKGIASWYGSKFHGRHTSNGEIYDMYSMTAAHKTLPLPSYARVTNLSNGRSIIVRINDRGPFHENRLIDLSYVGAAKLNITAEGTGWVEVRTLSPGQNTAKNAREQLKSGIDTNVFLQVGAFRVTENAHRLRNRLSKAGFEQLRIARVALNGNPIFRVQLGPLKSIADADKLVNRLRNSGIERTVFFTE